jgi:hypothetical protein
MLSHHHLYILYIFVMFTEMMFPDMHADISVWCVCVRQKFNVRIKEGPDRSNVQVPRMLERDGRLSCGFQQRHGMLQSVAIDAGTGAQFEVVPDEPVPMVLSEVAHEPQLPAVIRHMIEKKEYLRAEARGRVLFFAPVLRENRHAVDYSRLSG